MPGQALGILVFLTAVCFGGEPGGAEFNSKGEIAGESRVFSDDDEPATRDSSMALFTRIEATYKNGPWRGAVRAFGRVDQVESQRDISALEEAWFGYRTSNWDLRLGYRMLNWTATEAFHPADIINSRNLDSNIENPEKLGEVMASARRSLAGGSIELYYLPRFEEPRLPSGQSRLAFVPPGIEIGDARLLASDGSLRDDGDVGDQWGTRLTQVIGDSDFSVYFVDHYDRQTPGFIFEPEQSQVRPVYSRVRDLGLTYSHVLGAWLLKLEASRKDFRQPETNFGSLDIPVPPDHTQVAFGIEYGWSRISGSESTVLLEGQNYFGVDQNQRAALGAFQRDLLLGFRHAWNDRLSREVLVTVIFDVERDHEYLFNLRYQQRLTDTWSLRTGVRLIDAPVKGTGAIGLEVLDDSNQWFLTVSRYF